MILSFVPCTFTKALKCGSESGEIVRIRIRNVVKTDVDPFNTTFSHHICTLPLGSPSSSIWNRSEEHRAVYRVLRNKIPFFSFYLQMSTNLVEIVAPIKIRIIVHIGNFVSIVHWKAVNNSTLFTCIKRKA